MALMQRSVVSLFSGAGGLDLGLSRFGLQSAVCIDLDHDSIETLRMNTEFRESALLETDIRKTSGEDLLSAGNLQQGDVSIVIGGPPCQSFSKAGYWTSTGEEARRRRGEEQSIAASTARSGRARDVGADPRSSLLSEYARILNEVKPQAFIFENVVSITHPSNRMFFESFLRECESLGFSIQISKINATHFGVPQARQRVIVAGLIGKHAPPALQPTHGVAKNRRPPLLCPIVTAGDAISHLDTEDLEEKEEWIVGRYADHLAEIPPGSNYKALTAWAGHPNPSFIAETRFWHFLLKLHPDKPSWTIAANPGPWVGPFHWNTRRLRIPELAALQTFPDSFSFAGTRRSVQRQIGNAVPPTLSIEAIRTVAEPVLGVQLGD